MSSPEILSKEDFNGLSMKQLVEWFNENCAENEIVKSFRTLAVGVNRCSLLMERIDDQIAFEEETDHLTDAEFESLMREQLGVNDPELATNIRKSIDEATMPGDDAVRAAGITQPQPKKERQKARSNSDGVATSWLQPETAKKRVTRNHVTVTYAGKTEEFASVRKAFSHLGLPDSKHIRFRGKLKKSGEEIFDNNGEKFIFKLLETKNG